jgi:hypothetical protein
VTRQKDWPRDAAHLSNKLRRLTPDLRRAGIHVVFEERKNIQRKITIKEILPPQSSKRPEEMASPVSLHHHEEKIPKQKDDVTWCHHSVTPK